MTKMIKVAILAMMMGACAGRPAVHATPEQQSRAVTVLIRGGTMDDVATALALSRDEARRVVRMTIRDLKQGLQRRE